MRSLAIAILAGAALLVGGCGVKTVKTSIVDNSSLRVFLRGKMDHGQPVSRGYSQPVTISSTRLANILSRIDVVDDKTDARSSALPLQMLYLISDAVSAALEQADPSQEVVVMAMRRERRFGVFSQRYLTSFVLWVEGVRLIVSMGHVDFVMSKDPDERVPEPKVGKNYQTYRVVPNDGLTVEGPRQVAAIWRDDRFRRADNLTVDRSGKMSRRSILMEAPEEADDGVDDPTRSTDKLSPAQLRDLADLEEARERGEVTESDYQSQRYEILGRKE